MNTFKFEYQMVVRDNKTLYRCVCKAVYNGKEYQANKQQETSVFDENKIKQDLIQYINGTT